MNQTLTESDIEAAVHHLQSVDRVLGEIVARVGPYEPAHRGEPFVALARAIVGQQISVSAAASIWARFAALCPGACPEPSLVATIADESLFAAGLSRQKAMYLKDLAGRFLDGTISADELPLMPDEEVIAHLTGVKGIGRWTAEMFLIFSLRRPDVLPVDDLGFRNAVQRAYGLPDRPTAGALRELGETWRPYRSVATWYLWQSLRLAPLDAA